ncbi:hypothetical protein KC19_2G092000 [Ceratodon purpureus]|uniref:Glycosyltransferase n=1 Tax=Ceratodon purpureus TaxID=3225 RepID=A0A8T0IUS4_CERPU|nr:hypothetical protein KC19_2G092000 [Ceratodon purpureus]
MIHCAVIPHAGEAGAMGSVGNQPSSPHVVMIGSPIISHCVVGLLLAKKLCAFGVHITVINTESVITKLKAFEGLLGDDNRRLRVIMLPNGEGFTPSDSLPVLIRKAEERTSRYIMDDLKGLMESSQDWAPPCCAIVDLFADWVLEITDPLMPSYILWTAGAASLSMLLHAPVLVAQGIIPMEDSETEKLKPVEFPCIPPLHPLEFIDSIATPGFLASGFLVNSVYELESAVFDALNKHYQVGAPSSKLQSIHSVGPLINTSDEPGAIAMRRDPVLEWLDKQPHASVLYVAFGSYYTLSASQLIELGLEASEQRFIWVVRPPSDLCPELEAQESEVPEYLPSVSMRIVLLIEFLLSIGVDILQHPATGGFFTHCGWSSVIESISANLPMLAWPIQAEQKMNSRWLVDIAGATLQVRSGFEDFATREQVANAVRLLMCKDKGQDVRSNVSRLKELLQRGAAESEYHSTNIKVFIEKLQQWTNRAYAS